MNETTAAVTVELECVTTPTAELRAMIDELDRELSRHYDETQRHGLSVEAIFQPHVRFFIARLDGSAAGCGGVALCDGFAEVKRMFVRPEARGRGVADAILAWLAAEALDAGRTVLRLETGTHQHAAIRFYRRSGFLPCEPFGPYTSMPPAAVSTSVFLEKPLAPT